MTQKRMKPPVRYVAIERSACLSVPGSALSSSSQLTTKMPIIAAAIKKKIMAAIISVYCGLSNVFCLY